MDEDCTPSCPWFKQGPQGSQNPAWVDGHQMLSDVFRLSNFLHEGKEDKVSPWLYFTILGRPVVPLMKKMTTGSKICDLIQMCSGDADLGTTIFLSRWHFWSGRGPTCSLFLCQHLEQLARSCTWLLMCSLLKNILWHYIFICILFHCHLVKWLTTRFCW